MQTFNSLPLTLANGPCKDCPNRAMGCHSTCEEYIAFRAECDALIDKRIKRREVNDCIADAMKRMPGIRKL